MASPSPSPSSPSPSSSSCFVSRGAAAAAAAARGERCPDCTAAYQLFVIEKDVDENVENNEKTNEMKKKKRRRRMLLLERLRSKCLEIAERLVGGDYIWHLEGFKLNVVCTLSQDMSQTANPHLPAWLPRETEQVPHLYGTTCYGDNVEDEWLIVWILKQITSNRYKEVKTTVCSIKTAEKLRASSNYFLLLLNFFFFRSLSVN